MTDWAPPGGKYRPKPDAAKKKSRQERLDGHRSRVFLLLALLILVAAGAFSWYRWIGPERQQNFRERLRPPGKISIQLSE